MLSSIAIAATATLLGVGTYAKFSDTEKSPQTNIGGRHLRPEVGFIDDNLQPAATPTYSVDNAKPGDVMPDNFGSQGSGFMLHNAGSLPGALHVYLVKDSDLENGVVPPEAAFEGVNPDATGEIDNYLQVMVDGNTFGYGGLVPWMGLADTPVDITSMICGRRDDHHPRQRLVAGVTPPLRLEDQPGRDERDHVRLAGLPPRVRARADLTRRFVARGA